MVVSQGWQHLKINKAQVPHPGRPWQMRVIHSLAQFLRDASQAGQAVPGTSPSYADEVHWGVGWVRAGGGGRLSWGISNSSAGVHALPRICTFSEAGACRNRQAPEASNLNVYTTDLFQDPSNSLTIQGSH